MCCSVGDPVYTCCNPYHWSRLCRPESPPPPYCRFAKERLKPEDRAPSEGPAPLPAPSSGRPPPAPSPSLQPPSSLATNGEGEGAAGASRGWCTLAYWELATRVGRLFSVEPPAVNVFSSQPHGDGLCLATLASTASTSTSTSPGAGAGASPPPDCVRRTRAKIGLGLTLSCEADGVWAYNRSDGPIFVNSPTLDDPDSRTLLVYRVPSGHCLNVFERDKAEEAQLRRVQWDRLSHSGPTDHNSVRISFAKGWGPKYSRQEVTACPCWLEVLLVPCR